jgi:hypothetical protein
MKRFQKFGYAALLAAFVFAGCEQAALDNPAGEPIALNAAKSVSKVTLIPNAWYNFGSLPFAGAVYSGIPAVNGLATDGTFLVAVGYDGTTSPTGTAYVSRYDSLSGLWSNPQDLTPYGLTIKPGAAHYLNGYFLVTGGSTTTNGVFSPDGLKWIQTGNIGFGGKAAVYGYAQHLYVVAGQGGRAAYSPSLGNSFITVPNTVTGWPNSGGAAFINAGAYGSGRYVFGGGSGRIAYTSDITSTDPWDTADITATSITSTDFINAIVYGSNDTFVAAGNTSDNPSLGILVVSVDGGLSWTQADTSNTKYILTATIYALAYGDGYYVAVNDNGYAAYSTDGNIWYDAAIQPPQFTTGTNQPRVDAAVFYPATNTFVAGGGDDTGVRVIESGYTQP